MQTQDTEGAILREVQHSRNGWELMGPPDVDALAPTLPFEACQLTIDRSHNNLNVVVSLK